MQEKHRKPIFQGVHHFPHQQNSKIEILNGDYGISLSEPMEDVKPIVRFTYGSTQ